MTTKGKFKIMKNNNRYILNIEIEKEIAEELKLKAQVDGRSLSSLVRYILKNFLENKK